MASLAISLLLEQIEAKGQVEPVSTKLPTELVRRDSV
jgi:DNA-binding LacI/PurR family transcriptional regulator